MSQNFNVKLHFSVFGAEYPEKVDIMQLKIEDREKLYEK